VKQLSHAEMRRLLERKGWVRTRTGRHPVYTKPGVPGIIPLPDHGGKMLGRGLQRKIMRQAGLTEADLWPGPHPLASRENVA
jgi:predicted RNA binding protein YcfA (HicA-like mRNA interferase family)